MTRTLGFCASILLSLTCLTAQAENYYELDSRLSYDDNVAHFYDATKGAKVLASTSKLQKIERHNQQVGAGSPLFINYRAEMLSFKDDSARLRTMFRFSFTDIDEQQYEVIKGLYGGFAGPAKPGRQNYSLTDFMPPLIQALDGKGFNSSTTKVEQINIGRTGVFPANDAPLGARVSQYTNCWTTAYEILRSMYSGELSFSTFSIAAGSVLDVFRSEGTLEKTVRTKVGRPVDFSQFNDLKFGDLILILPVHQLYTNVQIAANGTMISGDKGDLRPILEHAAIYIDDGIIFEKSDSGAADPYRFFKLDASVNFYHNRDNTGMEVPATQIEVYRYSKPLPHPQVAFGGTRNASERGYDFPLVGRLNELLLIQKDFFYPAQDNFYNDYGASIDVALVKDGSGRYVLQPEAFTPPCFDLSRRAEELLRK